jgi:uncharacterized protein
MNHLQENEIVQKTEQHVHELLCNDNTGHDWWHTKRVYDLALHIAEEEKKNGSKVDLFVVKLAALLHDIADWKFQNGDELVGPQKAKEWLSSMDVAEDAASHICQIIKNISFKGAGVIDAMPTIEGAIVQDADRLDALGAVGIARCFATGTKLGNTIHDPKIVPTMHKTVDEYKKLRSTSINHFYEKLFLLKGRMKTKTGRRLAERRHDYMETYIQRFLCEWDGKE